MTIFIRKFFIGVILSALLLYVFTSTVYALDVPSFPTCSNPQGSLKVSHPNGVHGIVGNSSEFRGSDSVYQIDGNRQLVQCFCAENGSGIQTNWLKASSATSNELQVLQNDGWNVIPNGSLWGLDDASYIAKNNNYSCRGSVAGDSANTSGVLGATTKAVLGLASTGNIITIYVLFVLGFFTLSVGFVLRKKTS